MQENKRKKKTRFNRIVKRGVIFLSILLCFVIVFVTAILYFSPVRQFVLSNVLNIANDFLLADISIKDIYFNGLNNIIVENLLIKTDQDTLANVKKININYNLKSLITNNIQINKIEIIHPQILLLRSTKDSLWNYNKIVNPSENNELTTKSDLNISVNQIIIDNGKFKYWDSVTDWRLDAYFNPIQMEWVIKSFYAKNVNVNLSKQNYSLDIAKLITNELNSKINVKNFSSKIQSSEKGIYANNSNLILINTPNSKELEANINFNAQMTNFNIFGEYEDRDIDKALMSLNLNATGFNCDFIDNFQILPIKLGEVKKISINMLGTLISMQVPNLSLDIDNSSIQLKNIKLANLTNPDKLSYQGEIDNAKIISNDIQNFLTDLNLKKLHRLNQASINQTYFYGTTDSIFTKIDVTTNVGNAYGDISIAFGKKDQKYNISIETNCLNLQGITGNSNLASNINSTIKIEGKHFAINNLNATVDIILYPSIINRFTIDTSIISCSYKASDFLTINDCKIVLNNKRGENANANILINGNVDIKDYDNPKANLCLSFSNINPAYLLDDTILPKTLTGNISMTSEGMSLYNLIADATINIDEIIFNNKSLFPFAIDVTLSLNNDNNNNLHLSANNIFENIFDVNMQGKFAIKDMIYYINRDVELISNFVAKKTNDTTYNSININELHKNNETHNNVDFTLKITTTGLGYLDFMDDDLTINSTDIYANIKYHSDFLQTSITIDSINIYDLKIMNSINFIQIDSLYISSNANINNDFQNPINSLNIEISSNQTQQYNTLNISNLHSNVLYDFEKISFDIMGNFNEIINLMSDGSILLNNNDLMLVMNTLSVGLNNYYLKNYSPIEILYSDSQIDVKHFNLTNDNEEHIELSGIIGEEKMSNLTISANNFNIDNIRKNIFNQLNIAIPKINGLIDSVYIIADGLFNDLMITANLNVTNLNYDNYSIGNFHSELYYMDKNLSANANINVQSSNTLLSLVVAKFPLALFTDSNFANIDTTKQIDISLKINDLPSQIVAPFVPQVDNLSGLINGNFDITGYFPNRYEYNGQLEMRNLKMRIVPINMQYIASGIINANTNNIFFNSIKIKNIQQDINNGEATIDGKIKLNGLKLDSFDIAVNTKQLQILSDNTQTVMPFLYGEMIIATNGQPIRIFGTFDKPNLSGSVYILNADIKIPQLLNNQIVKRETKFNYINKDCINLNVSNRYDTTGNGNNILQESFIDLLNIDINLRINRFAIALELGNIGNIFARVGTKEPNAQLTYKKLRTSKEAKIYGGELEILDGSTLQIYKTMLAKGTISFPTARISQPTLDLTAEYKGKTTSDYPVNYSVFVGIKGTPQNPEIDLTYAINGNIVSGDKQQVQLDAFNILTRGIVRGYNDGNSSNLLGENNISNISNLFASQFASKTLTDLLVKTGIVQSANLKFDNDNINSANVSISGLLYSYITWTLGGKIEDIASNYNFSFDFPFNFNYKFLNNILLQLSRTTDVNNAVFDKNAKDWEVNLKFNGNW